LRQLVHLGRSGALVLLPAELPSYQASVVGVQRLRVGREDRRPPTVVVGREEGGAIVCIALVHATRKTAMDVVNVRSRPVERSKPRSFLLWAFIAE